MADEHDIFSHDKMDEFLARPTREIFGELLDRIEKLERELKPVREWWDKNV